MGLAAWDHHVVAPYCHRSVLVASLLESCFTLQPGVPFDHTWGLPIGWHASGNSHLAFLWPGHDGGRRQGHACQWPSCRGDREDEVTELLSRELSKPIKDRALVVSVLVSVVSHRLYLWSALIKLREWIRWTDFFPPQSQGSCQIFHQCRTDLPTQMNTPPIWILCELPISNLHVVHQKAGSSWVKAQQKKEVVKRPLWTLVVCTQGPDAQWATEATKTLEAENGGLRADKKLKHQELLKPAAFSFTGT